METDSLSSSGSSRRRRIGMLAGGLLLAGLLLAWLEAGSSIVVYNDTGKTITHLTLRVGSTVWTVEALAPEESRRWRPPAGVAGELALYAPGWDAARPPVLAYPPARAGNLILRVGEAGLITSSSEPAWWNRLAEW